MNISMYHLQSKPLLSDFSFLNFGTEIIQEYIWINSLLSEQLLPLPETCESNRFGHYGILTCQACYMNSGNAQI